MAKLSATLNTKFGSFTVSLAAAGVMFLVVAMMTRSRHGKMATVRVEVPQTDALEDEYFVMQKVSPWGKNLYRERKMPGLMVGLFCLIREKTEQIILGFRDDVLEKKLDLFPGQILPLMQSPEET